MSVWLLANFNLLHSSNMLMSGTFSPTKTSWYPPQRQEAFKRYLNIYKPIFPDYVVSGFIDAEDSSWVSSISKVIRQSSMAKTEEHGFPHLKGSSYVIFWHSKSLSLLFDGEWVGGKSNFIFKSASCLKSSKYLVFESLPSFIFSNWCLEVDFDY